MPYNPPRQQSPSNPASPLEIDLVRNVRPCGTCSFFWPEDPSTQPYGPYPSYDFTQNFPKENTPSSNGAAGTSFVWLKGETQPGCFPEPEVMDGCRKAPIMTIGINPNLTAFGPGTTGASWCYPSFSSDADTDAYAKYAYYYRYRSVYQEHFALDFSKSHLLAEGQVKAANAGTLKDYIRADDSPTFDIHVLYDGDTTPTAIHLAGTLGAPQYVALFDVGARFAVGDVLAARLNVPAGLDTAVYGQSITYYTQLLPVLNAFEKFLTTKGHAGAKLRVGEDVGQLDMVACASPHWGPQWLGGTSQSVNTVVKNCVQKNAWAVKQLLQTRPAVLYLVGQSSWTMFRHSFGHLVKGPKPLPSVPEDGPYTLLRLTTQQNYSIEVSAEVGSQKYTLSTRLVITPHFSYDYNFYPQFRVSPEAWKTFSAKYAPAARFLSTDPRVRFVAQAGTYVAAGFLPGSAAALADFKQKFAAAYTEIQDCFYDPHADMSSVLAALFQAGQLAWNAGDAHSAGFLSRSDGPCQFCENSQWKFPQGCPYGKPQEKQYPEGFLENVAAQVAASGTG
jgi:hypothetical protein